MDVVRSLVSIHHFQVNDMADHAEAPAAEAPVADAPAAEVPAEADPNDRRDLPASWH